VIIIIAGVESVSMEMKEQKLTLIGDMDAVVVVEKLRKLCYTEILSYGAEKVENKEKKEEKKKPEEKKQPEKKNNDQTQNIANILKAYETYHNHYHYTSYVEENPNACVIC